MDLVGFSKYLNRVESAAGASEVVGRKRSKVRARPNAEAEEAGNHLKAENGKKHETQKPEDSANNTSLRERSVRGGVRC